MAEGERRTGYGMVDRAPHGDKSGPSDSSLGLARHDSQSTDRPPGMEAASVISTAGYVSGGIFLIPV